METRSHGKWAVIAVGGELDLYTAPQLRDAVLSLPRQDAPSVALDLTDVGFIDSSGLGEIISCLKHVRQLGGELALVTPPTSPLIKLLTLTGLDDALPTVASVEEV